MKAAVAEYLAQRRKAIAAAIAGAAGWILTHELGVVDVGPDVQALITVGASAAATYIVKNAPRLVP